MPRFSHSNSDPIPDSEKAAPVSEGFSGVGSQKPDYTGFPFESRTAHTIIGRPVPSPRAVAHFRELYHQQRGIELAEDEALELATRYLQLFVFGVTPPPGRDQNLAIARNHRNSKKY